MAKQKIEKPEEKKVMNAMALVKREDGHFAVATLRIVNKQVETVDITSFDILPYTMARAKQIMQQQIIDLKKA